MNRFTAPGLYAAENFRRQYSFKQKIKRLYGRIHYRYRTSLISAGRIYYRHGNNQNGIRYLCRQSLPLTAVRIFSAAPVPLRLK